MNQLGSGENVTRRTAESSSVLDVLGLNYAEGRYAPDRELFPHRVIVGSETFPSRIGTLWPMVRRPPERDRRLHLDRLGLPRRGRHRRHRLRRRPRRGAAARAGVPLPDRLVRRPRHHRSPPSGLLLPRDRLRAAQRAVSRGSSAGAPRATPSPCSPPGPGATRSVPGPGRVTRASPSPSRCTPTPTKSHCCSTERRSPAGR